MVSENRCLKFLTILKAEESAACIALEATKYKLDIKLPSSLVQ